MNPDQAMEWSFAFEATHSNCRPNDRVLSSPGPRWQTKPPQKKYPTETETEKLWTVEK